MKNELRIPLANGKEIVAAIGCDPNFPEIYVCVYDGDNWIQDICLIRPHEEDEVENGDVDCLVWGDEYSEDYTHQFIISQYVEEEE